jgi:hypothetical protein
VSYIEGNKVTLHGRDPNDGRVVCVDGGDQPVGLAALTGVGGDGDRGGDDPDLDRSDAGDIAAIAQSATDREFAPDLDPDQQIGAGVGDRDPEVYIAPVYSPAVSRASARPPWSRPHGGRLPRPRPQDPTAPLCDRCATCARNGTVTLGWCEAGHHYGRPLHTCPRHRIRFVALSATIHSRRRR